MIKEISMIFKLGISLANGCAARQSDASFEDFDN